MSAQQLDLLAWRPPVRIVVFPLSANIGKVRRTAEVLSRKKGKDADGYWRRIIQPMADRLATAGVSIDEIRHEVDGFSAAVQREMVRLAYAGDRRQPGGGDAA